MTPSGPEFAYVEKPSMDLLGQLGWAQVDAFQETLGPQGTLGRDSQHDVVLTHRLRFAMRKLNDPDVPDASINEAIEVLTKDRSVMDRVRANREVYDLLRDGYRAEWVDDLGDKRIETLHFLDLKNPASNDLLAVQQMWVKGHLHSRRLDVALFVNGVPLVLMEFKEPGIALKSAYDDNLTDYRDTIPQLFIPNCFVLLSNGSEAKVGATYAPWEFFGDWKVIDAAGTRGAIALETALRGTCDPAILLDLFENGVGVVVRDRLRLRRTDGFVRQRVESGGELRQRTLGVRAARIDDHRVLQIRQLVLQLARLRLPKFGEPVQDRVAQRGATGPEPDDTHDGRRDDGAQHQHHHELRLDAHPGQQLATLESHCRPFAGPASSVGPRITTDAGS